MDKPARPVGLGGSRGSRWYGKYSSATGGTVTVILLGIQMPVLAGRASTRQIQAAPL